MLTLVVSLHIHAGHEAEFERFEAQAAQIMSRYGGRIERRIRHAGVTNHSQPDEVHLVTFPDAASFELYRSDGELAGLAPLRARANLETTVWVGDELPPFADSV